MPESQIEKCKDKIAWLIGLTHRERSAMQELARVDHQLHALQKRKVAIEARIAHYRSAEGRAETERYEVELAQARIELGELQITKASRYKRPAPYTDNSLSPRRRKLLVIIAKRQPQAAQTVLRFFAQDKAKGEALLAHLEASMQQIQAQ